MQEKEKKQQEKLLLEKLIAEIVKESLIKEQYDYRHDMLYQAFIEPFTDIWKTAQHGAEKIIATASGETKTLAKQLAFLLIPFIKPDAGSLKNMAAQDRQRMAGRLGQIDNKFKDVLDRNWKAFNNPDLWGTLFLMHPQLAIAQKIGVAAPELALELLSTLTGGNESVERILNSYRQMRTGGGRVTSTPYQADYSQYQGDSMWGQDYAGDYGGSLEEQQQQQQPAQPPQRTQQPTQQAPTQQAQPQQQGQQQNPKLWARQQINALLKDPTIRKQMTSSRLAKAMQGEAVRYIVQAAKKDLNINFQQIKAKAGADFPKLLKQLEAKLGPEVIKNIETNPEMQKQIVTEIKNLLKPAYIKQLQTLLKTNPAASQAVNKGIQQIQSI